MSKLLYYVAEADYPENSDLTLVVKNEISQEEVENLNSAFKICGPYHSITMIKNIVIENGESFKHFMTSQNLQELRKSKVSRERLITLANKSILNYASSIKTYIDMETRLLKKAGNGEGLRQFTDMQHSFYDNNMEYRFWANFRNYIVHCEFPYSGLCESVDSGYRIICRKEHLLQFDNWKHSKVDIEKMGEEIDLPALIDSMSSMILVFYIHFFSCFTQDIISGIERYGNFCIKYNVHTPVIFKTEKPGQVIGSQIQPLPVNDLRAAFDILKSNPHVKINII